MAYKTLMVHVKLGHANRDLLGVTFSLASALDVHVIGIAACQPTPIVNSDGYSPGVFVEADLAEIHREINVAECEFRATFDKRAASVEWRSAVVYESIADYLARESGSADLVITSGLSFDPHDTARPEKPGDLVMQAGRPVLVVPRATKTLKLDRIVVAWKNTREARRALADALPLIKIAKQVTVLELAKESERTRVSTQLSEICCWLKTHGITASPEFVALGKGDHAYQLDVAIRNIDADLVVAGAYGHSRFREWALGGVTRDLMLQANYCALLSH